MGHASQSEAAGLGVAAAAQPSDASSAPSSAALLERNLEALREHRPALHGRLLAHLGSTRYRLIRAAGGGVSIADTGRAGGALVLSAGGDPMAAVRAAIVQVKPLVDKGASMALLGVGDGYLLRSLAQHRPKLFMDQAQTIHVIEPEPALLLACLRLHDYAGSTGPIAQERVRFHVGPDWADQLNAELMAQPMLPPPTACVVQGADGEALQRGLGEAATRHRAAMEAVRARVHEAYAGVTPASLAELLGPRPPRRPRVLLPSSRFTTVLQFAARDTAAAFEELGWESRVLMERAPHERNHGEAVLREIEGYRPDLVFLIDHLRNEQKGVYPPQLPVVCWAQDHLPNLMNPQAGAGVGPMDFVLSFCSPLFIDTYGYPARQVIDTPMMLTRPPKLPERWSTDGDDLAYVSNVSGPPARLLEALIGSAPGPMKPWLEALGPRVLGVYESGGSLCSYHDLRRIVMDFESERGAPLDEAARSKLVETLWNPVNIAAYRQQALAWVARAAERLGLRLSVYGRGWEDHPLFGRYARGVVSPGEPLQQLTRRTRINLNLEPYPCFTHQRLLDGVCAGGFFLVREHPGNRLMTLVHRLLRSVGDPGVQTREQALERMPASAQPELGRLLRDAACLSLDSSGDPIRQVRCWERAGVLEGGEDPLPGLDAVSFSDSDGCARLIERYVNDEPARRELGERQRRAVARGLTFTAGMRRVVARIGELLAASS